MTASQEGRFRLAWATDVHLDFLAAPARRAFAAAIAAQRPDGLVLTGDIATAASVESCLLELEDALDRPVWFVLGNHDYYGGSIRAVREKIATFHQRARRRAGCRSPAWSSCRPTSR